MGYLRRLLFVCLTFIATVVISACGEDEQMQSGNVYQIYYVNNDETKIVSREYVSDTEDKEALMIEFIGQLSAASDKLEYQAPLAGGFSILGYTLDNGLLTMNFDGHYRDMESTKEVLVRAAIVRTLAQTPGIDYVSFTVQGEQLTDSAGMAVGMMAADSFIENAGNEINAYEKVNLRLYFANEEGNLLVEENQRNVVYSSNISLEKLVVEKLLEGPKAEGNYPTINPETKIISVTVKDGTCYVNLNADFLNQPYSVTSDVTIYSITNSLAELSNINRVQILVNGETNISYRENVSLNSTFERNLDLLGSSSAVQQ